MLEIRSIADIPFRERDPWSLLNLDRADAASDQHDWEDGRFGDGAGPNPDASDGSDSDADGWDGDDSDGWDDDGNAGPDSEYYGFGYSRVDQLWLTVEGEIEPPPPVREVLLLGLHTPDDGDAIPDDLMLEFWIDPVTCEQAGPDDDYSITVKLSRFLDLWLPKISSNERTIVLAVCNPHETRIIRPQIPRLRPLWYPLGNVVSWCDDPGDDLGSPGILRLSAERAWLQL